MIQGVINIPPGRVKVQSEEYAIFPDARFFYNKIGHSPRFRLMIVSPVAIKINTSGAVPPVTQVNTIRIQERKHHNPVMITEGLGQQVFFQYTFNELLHGKISGHLRWMLSTKYNNHIFFL